LAIKLSKLTSSLEEVQFYSKCAFCKSFSNKMTGNHCASCNKKLKCDSNKHMGIFSIKEFIFGHCIKTEANISWHDFLNLEDELINFSSKNNALDYIRDDFFWYFLIQDIKVEEIKSIGEILMQFFFISDTSYKGFYERFHSDTQSFQENMNYTFNFPCYLGKKLDITNFDRNKLKDGLIEPFEFVY